MLQHQDFSAGIAGFFGRRAQHGHSDAGFIRDFRRCDARAHRHGRDQVVAAGVADSQQAIVFGADSDIQ
jgi:hypothetical protein